MEHLLQGRGLAPVMGPLSPVVGDFNGDGKPDLATANAGGNTVSILQGNGDGTFVARLAFKTRLLPSWACGGRRSQWRWQDSIW